MPDDMTNAHTTATAAAPSLMKMGAMCLDSDPGPLVWEDIEGVFVELFRTESDLLQFRKLLQS